MTLEEKYESLLALVRDELNRFRADFAALEHRVTGDAGRRDAICDDQRARITTQGERIVQLEAERAALILEVSEKEKEVRREAVRIVDQITHRGGSSSAAIAMLRRWASELD